MAYEPRRAPRPQDEAHEWAKSKNQGSHGMKDAAILNHIKLPADERGILHVGCAYGTFAIAASRVLHALTDNPATIVGIDNCQPLLDLADRYLDNEAGRNPAVRNTVHFCRMDAYHLIFGQHFDAIRALFPRGITTIVAIGVFKDMEYEWTPMAIRILTSLLEPGGRVVIGMPTDPPYYSTAHFVRDFPPDLPPRLVGVLDLSPPGTREHFRTQIRDKFNAIPGPTPRGSQVNIDRLEVTPMPQVWENFISRIGYNIPRGIRVNDEAWLDPARLRFYNVAHPELKCGDAYSEYRREAIEVILEKKVPMEGWVSHATAQAARAEARQQLRNATNGPLGLLRLEDELEEWLGDDPQLPRHREHHGAFWEGREVILESGAAITGPHNLERWDHLYLVKDSMLVTFHRAG